MFSHISLCEIMIMPKEDSELEHLGKRDANSITTAAATTPFTTTTTTDWNI